VDCCGYHGNHERPEARAHMRCGIFVMEERRITGRVVLAVFWILVIAALLVVPTYYQLEKEKKQQVGHGLIWLGDPELAQYFKRRHPATSMRSYGERAGNPARSHGRRAGREIVLHRGLQATRRGGAVKQLGSGA
jgi:hypothetical protein